MARKEFPVHLRYNDIDTYGHVNNAVYLTYFEQARLMYFLDVRGHSWDWHKDGLILARNEVDYKIPLLLTDTAIVEVWISHVGNKSFEMSYAISKEKNGKRTLCTTGKSVLVSYDLSVRLPAPIPPEWRKILEEEMATAKQ